MTIEGSILEVMESWPLQLIIKTPAGRWHVALLTTTTIALGPQQVDPGELVPGLAVVVSGHAEPGPQALTAEAIHISPGR